MNEKPQSKRIAIVQSSYIPWRGYFSLIDCVDEFVLLDSVQFTKRDWRNRNRIKTASGTQWLTIPVISKGRFEQSIRETAIAKSDWNLRHWHTIQRNYAKAPFFAEYETAVGELYASATFARLSDVNAHLLRGLCELLQIETRILSDAGMEVSSEKSERLADICQQREADVYVSGPSAQAYLDEPLFSDRQLQVEWMDYSHLAPYEQLYPPFDNSVSILDTLFHLGPSTIDSLRRIKEASHVA